MHQQKIVFSHPTGNANVRAALDGLYNSELLYDFHTSIGVFPDTWLDKAGGIPAFGEIKRRKFDKKLESYTKIYPWYEAGRLISSKLHLQKLVQHEKGFFSTYAVYRALDRKVAATLISATKN